MRLLERARMSDNKMLILETRACGVASQKKQSEPDSNEADVVEIEI
jgi:hypothetical protein